jgi:outer membrane biosynthesis protein TonB
MPRSKVGKALTRARKGTHGPFEEVAKITGSIGDIFRSSRNWSRLSPVAQMALQEIVHKQARILTGDYAHIDHWNDIGGYAQLGADAVVTPGPAKAARPKPQVSLAAVRKKAPVKTAAKKSAVRPKPKPKPKPAAKKTVVKKPAAKKTVVQKRVRPARTRPAPAAAQVLVGGHE